eukprot:ctg_227.g122
MSGKAGHERGSDVPSNGPLPGRETSTSHPAEGSGDATRAVAGVGSAGLVGPAAGDAPAAVGAGAYLRALLVAVVSGPFRIVCLAHAESVAPVERADVRLDRESFMGVGGVGVGAGHRGASGGAGVGRAKRPDPQHVTREWRRPAGRVLPVGVLFDGGHRRQRRRLAAVSYGRLLLAGAGCRVPLSAGDRIRGWCGRAADGAGAGGAASHVRGVGAAASAADAPPAEYLCECGADAGGAAAGPVEHGLSGGVRYRVQLGVLALPTAYRTGRRVGHLRQRRRPVRDFVSGFHTAAGAAAMAAGALRSDVGVAVGLHAAGHPSQ